MRKILLIVFLFTFITFVGLTACNNFPVEPATSPASTKDATLISNEESSPFYAVTPVSQLNVDEKKMRGTRVVIWHPWDGEEAAILDSIVDDFNAKNPVGIQVVAQGHANHLFQDFNASIGTENIPDIIIGYSHELLEANRYAAFLTDIKPYIEDPVWGLDQETKENMPSSLLPKTSNDEWIGLPIFRSANVLFYNQEWAKELGFESPPKTPKEFEEQACAAAATQDDGTGGWIANTNSTTLLSWIYAFGGNVLSPDKLEYRFDTPQVEAAFSFLRELFEKGCIQVVRDHPANMAFAERKGLFYSSSIMGIPAQGEAFETFESEAAWQVIPYPAESNTPVMITYGPNAALIQTDPEHQLASWLFLKWLIRPEEQKEWMQAGTYLPVNALTLAYLSNMTSEYPQWLEALNLAPDSRTEPLLPSWDTVRWALSDAGNALFKADFSSDQIPALIVELEATAIEIQSHNR